MTQSELTLLLATFISAVVYAVKQVLPDKIQGRYTQLLVLMFSIALGCAIIGFGDRVKLIVMIATLYLSALGVKSTIKKDV